MPKIWKLLKGYEYSYIISSEGTIVRLAKCKLVTNHKGTHLHHRKFIITQTSIRKGYALVCITDKNGKKKTHSVHILMMETFKNYVSIPYVNCIDHIDGNKLNNHLDNLEEINYRENTRRYTSITNPYTGITKSGSESFPYRVQVRYNHNKYNLGNYKTKKIGNYVYLLFVYIIERWKLSKEECLLLLKKIKKKYKN